MMETLAVLSAGIEKKNHGLRGILGVGTLMISVPKIQKRKGKEMKGERESEEIEIWKGQKRQKREKRHH